MTNKKYKIPVILYESEEQSLPYIEVQQSDAMPPALFIQEFKHTGEFEPSSDGEDAPIIDMLVHMYVDMEVLSKKLGTDLYDQVRVAVGLQPLQKARQEGQKILDKVYGNVNERVKEAHGHKQQTKDEIAQKLNERLTGKFFNSEEANSETEQSDKIRLQFGIAEDEEK
jgi:hypothetical protein